MLLLGTGTAIHKLPRVTINLFVYIKIITMNCQNIFITGPCSYVILKNNLVHHLTFKYNKHELYLGNYIYCDTQFNNPCVRGGEKLNLIKISYGLY